MTIPKHIQDKVDVLRENAIRVSDDVSVSWTFRCYMKRSGRLTTVDFYEDEQTEYIRVHGEGPHGEDIVERYETLDEAIVAIKDS